MTNEVRPIAARTMRIGLETTIGFVVCGILTLGLLAAPAAAETTLDVTTPADGRYQPGQPTPIIVTIEADRAVSGTLTASFDGLVAGSERVDVPGGSAKDIVILITTPPWETGGSIRFEADDDGDSASERLTLVANREDQLVGVLPTLGGRELPATADMRVEIGQARLYAVDPALLDLGPDSLSIFSHLVATPSDLTGLDPARLATLEAWVGGKGGILVIDDVPSTSIPIELDELPTGDSATGDSATGDGATEGSATGDSATGGSASARFGVGKVQFTGGRIAESGYDGLFSPTATRSTDEFPWGGGFGGAPSTMILAGDAGVSVPAIGSLLLVLLVYVVLIGPVLWLVLKRSKREPLIWLALPAVALVTTLGVYGVGRALRENATAAHATVIADVPSLQAVSTQILVTSPNGGNEGIQLPSGWRPAAIAAEGAFFEGPFGGVPVQVQPVLRGDDLVADLPPGGVGVLGAEATLAPAARKSWQLDLRDDGGSLTGTVTNTTDHDLDEVFIAAGQGFQRLRTVAAGESVDVSLQNANVPPMANDRLMETMWGFDPWSGNDDGSVNSAVFINWLAQRPLLRTPGFVMVVGWTRDESAPLLTTRGTTIVPGRTAFVTADRLADDVFGSEPYNLEFLRGWNSARVIDPPGNQCADFPITLRMTTTGDLLGPDPVLDLSTRSIAAFDLWDGREWRPAGVAEATSERLIVAVPDSALTGDELYLRVLLSCEFWEFANPFPDLRPAEPDDLVLTMGALGEEPANG